VLCTGGRCWWHWWLAAGKGKGKEGEGEGEGTRRERDGGWGLGSGVYTHFIGTEGSCCSSYMISIAKCTKEKSGGGGHWTIDRHHKTQKEI
jgi:hypothetical protein